MKNFAAALAGTTLLSCATPVFAADACGPLKEVNTVDLKISGDKSRAYVPVTINGVEKTFLLDTGGYASQIWPTAAKDLHLPIRESNGKLLDLYGRASAGQAVVDNFVLGHLGARNTSLLLSTFDADPNSEVSGILGPDFMGKYDTELDFAAGKMNYFATDHCDGRVVYWPAQVVAIVPMTFGNDHHIVIPVTLDGHPFRAMIDTGAPDTLIDADDARRVFDINEPGKDDVVLHDIDGKKQFVHIFSSLSFEGVAIGKPHLVIFPNVVGQHDPNNSLQTGSHIKRDDDRDDDPAITIGMNLLSKLHLYIAFNERKLYVTPASPPPAAAP
jgi:hypothetical protein